MFALTAHVLAAVILAVSGAVWPLDPRPEVLDRFDPPAERWKAGHRGVDLVGRIGQDVRAARAGTIAFAGRIAGRGVVVVSHGGTRTTYEPVSASVRVGQHVSAGERIGSLQLFGSHCLPGACLHWGLLRGEVYLDPLSLVGPQEVRLLPLDSSLFDADLGWSPFTTGGEPAGTPDAADHS
jgi:murein DD-endopeptidase MepM/ murein hydrolase activator NlpD